MQTYRKQEKQLQNIITMNKLQYSRISLIQYPQDEISAGSSNSVYINLSSFR